MRSARNLLPAALLLLLLLPAASSNQTSGRYGPDEWRSLTRTRFARDLAVGSRYVAVATEGGLLFYDRLAAQWQFPLTEADGLPTTRVDAVANEEMGGFAIQTPLGAGRVQPEIGDFFPGVFPAVRPPAPRLPANLFAGPDYQYLPDGRISGPDGLAAPVVAVTTDDEGAYWIATWGLGTGRADGRTLRLEMLQDGLWTADVRSVVTDARTVVAGGWEDALSSGGISLLDLGSGRWEYVLAAATMGLVSDRVSALALDGRTLWAGVDGGIARGSVGGRWRSWTVTDGLPDERITSLVVSGGSTWVGTWGGAVEVTADTLRQVPLPGRSRVLGIAAIPGGAWFATERGAYVWRPAGPDRGMRQLDEPQGRLDGVVDAVAVNGGEVWFAGPSGIVAYDSRRGTWMEVPLLRPFRPGEVTAMGVTPSDVWVATLTGGWRLIRGTGEWHRYTAADGLIDTRVQCLALTRDAVWFGTPSGLTRFDLRLRRKTP